MKAVGINKNGKIIVHKPAHCKEHKKFNQECGVCLMHVSEQIEKYCHKEARRFLRREDNRRLKDAARR